jgi:hypothetical protein
MGVESGFSGTLGSSFLLGKTCVWSGKDGKMRMVECKMRSTFLVSQG